MSTALADVCCASIPTAALPHLAALRTQPGLRITLDGDRAWLRWDAGHDEVLRRVLPIEGAELFALRDGVWYRPGRHLPAFHVHPAGDGEALARLLTPGVVGADAYKPEAQARDTSDSLACASGLYASAPTTAVPTPETPLSPLSLRLVRSNQPRPASAVCCSLAVLAGWAELATTEELATLTGAVCGKRVLVLGTPLPPLSEGLRYWGRGVLTPLGFAPEPALPEALLREALGLRSDEIALLHADGVEVLSREVLAPLTRAGIRLALRGSR